MSSIRAWVLLGENGGTESGSLSSLQEAGRKRDCRSFVIFQWETRFCALQDWFLK